MDPAASDVFTVVILMAAVGLRVALVAVVVWVLIPRRRQCPGCGEKTVAIVAPSAYKWLLLQRRWCMDCGWQGLCRRSDFAASDSVPLEHQPTTKSR
jgi:hypothetical protein